MRGLKLLDFDESLNSIHVAPLMGAWVETNFTMVNGIACQVAPLVGAWIETTMGNGKGFTDRHRPFRGCGLKYKRNHRLADNSALHFSTKTS